ncbi:hypothetical protein QCD69_22535, partial [Erwinia sp. PsM31]
RPPRRLTPPPAPNRPTPAPPPRPAPRALSGCLNVNHLFAVCIRGGGRFMYQLDRHTAEAATEDPGRDI